MIKLPLAKHCYESALESPLYMELEESTFTFYDGSVTNGIQWHIKCNGTLREQLHSSLESGNLCKNWSCRLPSHYS